MAATLNLERQLKTHVNAMATAAFKSSLYSHAGIDADDVAAEALGVVDPAVVIPRPNRADFPISKDRTANNSFEAMP
ncbi:hypothetical protein KBY96_10595 [Cyanobium sp. ATX 6A2]|uniref:hypothetical protein n=1 Tax=Cyanobium sp. ATX 6A2 TaxID=2823700 RepID=UPI0020CF53B9|nr:hypothetical protein [Cyanobium sp. ATX 6A2]MCP9888372.1 hypothetical protein [Cyanobium sp. ATX 6A2]